ncbi:hypothetical protein ACFOQM_23435 [Paenibacillus sp. GCM10012307]|uniref:hypothetical protein n=1 Tax=Paenibacillus sp. GCM10012307 TaxID=3317343 RepID=UPI003610E9C7
MERTYYVILVDGAVRLKDGSTLRKYKTRERAEKEAQQLVRYPYYCDRTVQTAEVSFINIMDIPRPESVDIPRIPPYSGGGGGI